MAGASASWQGFLQRRLTGQHGVRSHHHEVQRHNLDSWLHAGDSHRRIEGQHRQRRKSSSGRPTCSSARTMITGSSRALARDRRSSHQPCPTLSVIVYCSRFLKQRSQYRRSQRSCWLLFFRSRRADSLAYRLTSFYHYATPVDFLHEQYLDDSQSAATSTLRFYVS